ncbi:MAG: hypothetical protein FWC20_03305 [Oscillospiraceae bacterium]|nr:hypothetical protein [Oscillospiraceae bacterium]MCL2278419.1 hypothetical protein [Oscillospiraceae bacterium]
MRGYEITGRGKVIIAVLLVLIVLVIPSVVISLNALVREPPHEDPNIAEATPQPAEDPPYEIVERPLPDGGGLHPTVPENETVEGEQLATDDTESGNDSGDAAEEGNGAPNPSNPSDYSDSSDSSDSSQSDPPEQGLVGLNVAAGTMAFVYFPGIQNALDAETSAAIGEFLASPRNTANSRIIVQFPRLVEGDRLNIVNAVINELTERGVPRQDIIFFTIDEAVEGDSFEVSLSFRQDPTNGK